MKRVMRKRLKEDELVSTMTKLVDLAKKWSRQLIMGGTAVVIIILAFLISNAIRAQAIKRDSRILADILEISAQLHENPEKVVELESLAGDGKFTRIAYLKLAAFAIEQGDSGKAKSYLEEITDSRKDITYYQAQDMLAQVYIREKEYDKAIAIYRTIEEADQKDYAVDAVLFHMAEAHEGKGELDKALEIYKRVQEEYAQSFYGFDASKKVSELEGKRQE
jgi:predicted negative regulator of RcsB-dependent stress response